MIDIKFFEEYYPKTLKDENIKFRINKNIIEWEYNKEKFNDNLKKIMIETSEKYKLFDQIMKTITKLLEDRDISNFNNTRACRC